MCGRFGASYRNIKTVWNLHGDFSFEKRYNIAPSQEVPVIIRNEAKLMKYGLVPSAPNASMGTRPALHPGRFVTNQTLGVTLSIPRGPGTLTTGNRSF